MNKIVGAMFRDTPESGEFYAVGTDDIDIMPPLTRNLCGQQHIGLVSTTVTRTVTRTETRYTMLELLCL